MSLHNPENDAGKTACKSERGKRNAGLEICRRRNFGLFSIQRSSSEKLRRVHKKTAECVLPASSVTRSHAPGPLLRCIIPSLVRLLS
jgi:hypothetical protein